VWYCQNTPVSLTSEQETAIYGSGFEWLDTDCQAGTGGCVKSGSAPASVQCPPGVLNGASCGGPTWSEDETKNQVCSTDGDWVWVPGYACEVTNPYYCKVSFATCSWTGWCSSKDTVSGTATATTCEW
jgi:hypothetical protein